MQNRIRPASGRLGVLVLAVALTAAGCGTQGRTSSAPITLAALVRDGARATMSHRTADLTVSGSIVVAGHTIPVSGSGQSDFNAHATQVAMNMAIPGHPVTITERMVAGHLYMGIDMAGHTLKQMTGHTWYQLPIPVGGSADGDGLGDPAQVLALAEQRGAKVVSLGTRTIGGLVVSGYAVTPSRAAMLAHARSRLADLPPAQRGPVMRMVRAMKPPTMQMWFDKTQDLLRRLTMRMNLSLAPGASAAGTIRFDFMNFGTPVSIPVPAPSDVSTKAPGA